VKSAAFWIFQFGFGCRHGQLSRVFTIKKRSYQVCLQCGREFDYSWEAMRSVGSSPAVERYAPSNRVERTEVSPHANGRFWQE
jgi:hypothetical protein